MNKINGCNSTKKKRLRDQIVCGLDARLSNLGSNVVMPATLTMCVSSPWCIQFFVHNCSWMQTRHDPQCGSSSFDTNCDRSVVDAVEEEVTSSF